MQASEAALREAVQRGYDTKDLVPILNKTAAESVGRKTPLHPLTEARAEEIAQAVRTAKPAAPSKPEPTLLNVRPPETNASLETFTQRIDELRAHITGNPIKSLQDKPLLTSLTQAAKEAKALKAGGVSPEQIDRIIKSVNSKISQASDASTEGVWKHLLNGLHQDLSQAAAKTKDPAFEAFADAIHEARLNFLRRDLQKVITNSGVRQSRTGMSVTTSPGKVIQWMTSHPEWEHAVEQAKPGLLDSIRQDIQEIVPITDTTGRSIPGQSFGSGRYALGASAAALIGRALGIPQGEAAAFGALLAGTSRLEAVGGLRMSPGYIQRSFQPTGAKYSPLGGLAGSSLGHLAEQATDRGGDAQAQ